MTFCPVYFNNYIYFDASRNETIRNAYHVKPITIPPKSKYGDKAFQNVFSKMWNDLPMDIKVEDNKYLFKSRLKEFLLSKQSDS